MKTRLHSTMIRMRCERIERGALLRDARDLAPEEQHERNSSATMNAAWKYPSGVQL